MYCGMRTLRCGTHHTHTHTCLQDLLVRREEQLRLQKKAKGNGPEDVNVSKSACSSDDRSTRKTEGETPTENVERRLARKMRKTTRKTKMNRNLRRMRNLSRRLARKMRKQQEKDRGVGI